MLLTPLRAAICAGCLIPGAASADRAALEAYVGAFEAGDIAACEATFAPGARFIDLGRDLSDRIPWFCDAVIASGGGYVVSGVATQSRTTTAAFVYEAGTYRASGMITLQGEDGLIRSLVIE
ncbi:hypothetical protein [Jannaschia sp. LMIT008]|uniref:hypothetical protein n=1 Tax=Jannaschia maritima TaxID=3032585 RepID=UPI002810A24C|nr:hypothetical protein [Jannaschia sp. LMIT008]